MFLVAIGLVGVLMAWILSAMVHHLPIILKNTWREESQAFLEVDVQSVGQLSVMGGYFILKLLTLFLSVFVAWFFGPNFKMIAVLIFTWGLLVLAFIDLEQLLLPDVVTIPFLWLGLLFSRSHLFIDVDSAIIGAMVGYIGLWIVAKAFIYFTDKEGIGHGDLKMLAMLGAWVGWQALPWVLLIASLLGSVVGLLILFKKKQVTTLIPFGPCLALAGWAVLLNNNGVY